MVGLKPGLKEGREDSDELGSSGIEEEALFWVEDIVEDGRWITSFMSWC
jgi:hypothetical protein